MSFAIKAFILSLLFVAAFTASTNVSKPAVPIKKPATDSVASKYSPVINNYYAGPNKEIKTVLREIQGQLTAFHGQLTAVREEIRACKGTRNETVYKKNCAELYKSGQTVSGVYMIDPVNTGPFEVFCDQTTTGGGWTVFQKRLDGSVDFYRDWHDYQQGFGNLNGEFWLGLEWINLLTNGERNKLRVELEDTAGKTAYAEYDLFAISSASTKYQLSLGTYSGTAGDSLAIARGSAFSTKDQDNDNSSKLDCAVLFKGGWWYNACRNANLNSLYHLGQHSSYADGVNWGLWKGHYYSAKRAEMKIRPANF